MKPRYIEYTKAGLLLELKRLHSIIKEAREYINNYNEVIKTNEYLGEYKNFMIIPKELLEILDKV